MQITSRTDGGVTYFQVENRELVEVTICFNFELINMQGTVGFPHTATFPPRQTAAAFSLTPCNSRLRSSYAYTNHYILGSTDAVHDDSHRYSLPYLPGSTFPVSQGHGGRFSHNGSNQYAIDWRMPEGTPVCAARSGRVVRVKDNSNMGGPHARFGAQSNLILIRHDDGTLAEYCHLKQGSALVREGKAVSAGDLIALSGNTGFSSGPHLHFSVYKTSSGCKRQSIPVKFNTAEEAATLQVGRRYTARTPASGAARVIRPSKPLDI